MAVHRGVSFAGVSGVPHKAGEPRQHLCGQARKAMDITGSSGYCHWLRTLFQQAEAFIIQLIELFTQALGLVLPWQVVDSAFSTETNRLDLKIDFTRGATFPCPVCGDMVPVHDTVEKTWRHMNFWQYETYLTARTPRVK